MAGRYRVGSDIGGTFTDFVMVDQATGRIRIEKVLTTPRDPSAAVMDGLSRIGELEAGYLRSTEHFIHGTTLVINAIIERKGARTGLIATENFRDILETRDEKRYDVYDLQAKFPEPLVPRYNRRGVKGRIYSDGSELVPLDRDGVATVIKDFVDLGIESVAVCLLHSYANPSHEHQVRDIATSVAPTLPISLSSDVLPEIREYPRTSTTVVNAYARPLIKRYLEQLEGNLRSIGCPAPLYLMLSGGGITSAETARTFPVRIIESGPAGGAIAAEYYGALAGVKDLLSFDMGGTTAKMCLIQNGRASRTADFEIARVERFKKGSGIPLRLPVVDLLEIGAGGGSIAHLNSLGLMQVGPESAGAEPGPASYGRGGMSPTVTDSDVVLGYLNPDYFLGGEMSLDRSAALKAMEKVAEPLGLDVIQAAAGVREVVDENMASAARLHILEKGENPSRFTLVAFGGAGPVHADGLARKLGIRRMLVPPMPGVMSAFGFLAAPISFDLVRTHKVPLTRFNAAEVAALYDELMTEAQNLLPKEASEPEYERSVDLRYVGQGYELGLSLSGNPAEWTAEALQADFEDAYRALYGHIYPDVEIELMNVRLVARSATPELPEQAYEPSGGLRAAQKESRPVYFASAGGFVVTPVYERLLLPRGTELVGPVVIEERESTTVIGPQTHVTVDANGMLDVTFLEDK